MNPIDYPVNFDSVVMATLAHPCFIDSRGNLYALRDDGAIMLVAGPECGTQVQFQGAGSDRHLAWAVTQEILFVHFHKNGQSIRAALPRTRDSIGIPTYRRSMLAVTLSSSAYLVHNTEDALYCFAVSPEGIRLCAKFEGHKGFGAWVEGGNLFVIGMRTRIHKTGKYWFSQGEWFSLKYGVGTVLRIELSNGRTHIDSAAGTKKALVAAWTADAGDSDDRYVKPLLEVWLDGIETARGRVLIGGIMDGRLSEFDDTFDEPHPSDFVGIALYRWREGEAPELLRLLRGVNYIGKMVDSTGEMLYFVKRENPRDVFTDRHYAMRVSPDMQSPLLPVTFDWANENLWTAQFNPGYDERVGAIAAVSTKIRDTPLPYQRHLAMSDNGLIWRFVHELPSQRR